MPIYPDTALVPSLLIYSDDASSSTPTTAGAEAEAADDEADTFQPSRCNVAFGSAHDGWAFRLDQFAAMYADKLGCR